MRRELGLIQCILYCLLSIVAGFLWHVEGGGGDTKKDDGADRRVRALLADRDESLALVKATIQEQLDTIVGDTEEETMTKDMLNTLVQFLT